MQTGNFQLVREINRRLIFGLIREGDGVSRAGLVGTTELSKATVSAVVDELIARGLVSEGTAAIGSVGRRPISLGINTKGPYLGAIQVKPDGVVGALTDLNGRVVEHLRQTCRVAEGRSLIKATIEMLKAVARLAIESERAILGVGVSVPGILNPPADVVLSAPALGWRDVSLRRMLEAAAGIPVWLGDEAKAAALAEATAGSGRGAEVLVYLGVGSMVGAGLVEHGRLAGGAHAGHITILPEGPRCWCGNRGCLEAMVGELGLCRRAHELMAAGRRFRRTPADLSAAWLDREAKAGDPLAMEILLEASRWLGIGLAGLINLYQPELVLIGGWCAGSEPLLAAVKEEAYHRALPAVSKPVRILPASVGEDAVLTGAAVLALEGALGRSGLLGEVLSR